MGVFRPFLRAQKGTRGCKSGTVPSPLPGKEKDPLPFFWQRDL